ncbi:hypothetical protein IAF70_09560 [Streptococcus thermophilus]|uniref:hypothetical protein n=1 Tax=Streptococcus thermophilus TaxID=1308 RepID=UPI001A99C84B|nr:hypothetical protein [Streptococcus thermophilus]MBO1149378.1 hypothetical protein [Streptococcus thermophilus]
MNKLFIGIDVSSKELQIAITDSKIHQTPLANEAFSNDLVGASEVKEVILDLAQKNHTTK